MGGERKRLFEVFFLLLSKEDGLSQGNKVPQFNEVSLLNLYAVIVCVHAQKQRVVSITTTQ